MAVEFRIDRFAASGSAPGYVLGGLDLRCCVRNRGYTGLLVPMSIEPLAQVRITMGNRKIVECSVVA